MKLINGPSIKAIAKTVRIVDKNNRNWKDNVDYNLMTLRACQQYLNNELIRKGRILLF